MWERLCENASSFLRKFEDMFQDLPSSTIDDLLEIDILRFRFHSVKKPRFNLRPQTTHNF